jgi:hypothetical protein
VGHDYGSTVIWGSTNGLTASNVAWQDVNGTGAMASQ